MRKYIIAGLLVWMPLAITIWVLSWLLGMVDGVFFWLLSLTSTCWARTPMCSTTSCAKCLALACW